MSATRVFWVQAGVLAVLTAAIHVADLLRSSQARRCDGLVSAWSVAGVAFALALLADRFKGEGEWRRTVGGLAIGVGVLGVGLLPSLVHLTRSSAADEGLIPAAMVAWFEIVAASGAILGMLVYLLAAAGSWQTSGERMNRPLRIVSLILGTYVFARILARVVSSLTQSKIEWAGGPESDAVYDTLILSLAAAGFVMSALHAAGGVKMSVLRALAFGIGAVVVASAAAAACGGGDARTVAAATLGGLALLVAGAWSSAGFAQNAQPGSPARS